MVLRCPGHRPIRTCVSIVKRFFAWKLDKGHRHRWPSGKIDGPGKWNKTHLNQWNPSIFNQAHLKRTPMHFRGHFASSLDGRLAHRGSLPGARTLGAVGLAPNLQRWVVYVGHSLLRENKKRTQDMFFRKGPTKVWQKPTQPTSSGSNSALGPASRPRSRKHTFLTSNAPIRGRRPYSHRKIVLRRWRI